MTDQEIEQRETGTSDADRLAYRADALDELRKVTSDVGARDELARAVSAIRGVAGRLRHPEITAEAWESAARKAFAMYDWKPKEVVAINDFIMTVNDAAARILSEGIVAELESLLSVVEALRADKTRLDAIGAATVHVTDHQAVISRLGIWSYAENASPRFSFREAIDAALQVPVDAARLSGGSTNG